MSELVGGNRGSFAPVKVDGWDTRSGFRWGGKGNRRSFAALRMTGVSVGMGMPIHGARFITRLEVGGGGGAGGRFVGYGAVGVALVGVALV